MCIVCFYIQAYSLKCTERYWINFESKSRRLVYKSVAMKIEVRLKFRLVCRLDGAIPFHREKLTKNDAAAEIANYLYC